LSSCASHHRGVANSSVFQRWRDHLAAAFGSCRAAAIGSGATSVSTIHSVEQRAVSSKSHRGTPNKKQSLHHLK
jgi:hypothetical protein